MLDVLLCSGTAPCAYSCFAYVRRGAVADARMGQALYPRYAYIIHLYIYIYIYIYMYVYIYIYTYLGSWVLLGLLCLLRVTLDRNSS